MEQAVLDQAYDAMIDDFWTGDRDLISDWNLFNLIDRHWLMPMWENYPVMKLKQRHDSIVNIVKWESLL